MLELRQATVHHSEGDRIMRRNERAWIYVKLAAMLAAFDVLVLTAAVVVIVVSVFTGLIAAAYLLR